MDLCYSIARNYFRYQTDICTIPGFSPRCQLAGVLIYEKREEWVEEEKEEKKQEQLDVGLESLADKYGLDQLKDAMARLTIKEV